MMQLTRKTALCGLLLCASFSLGVLAPDVAHAQGEGSEDGKDAEFKARLAKGNEYYQAGNLEKALVEFEAAYAIKPNPKLLYNIGLIYERLGKLKKAVDHYERFIVAPDVPLELRSNANDRLELLRPIVEAQDAKEQEEARKKAEAAKKAEEIEVAEIDPEDGKTTDTKKAVTTTDPEKPEADGPGAGPVIGLTLLGLGVAAGATGGVMLATLDDEMAFVQEPTPDARRDARDRRSRNATIGIGLAAGGGALAVTGATIWLVSRKKGGDAAEKSAVFVPVIGPDGQMGLGFSRRF